jgi:hypothetical protein
MVGMAENPKAEIIFPSQDDRPDGSEDVVEGNGDDGGEFAAPEHPGEEEGKQCLEAGEWSKSPKDAECHAAGDGMRSIPKLVELLGLVFYELSEVGEGFHCIFPGGDD